jgi:Zn-dependent M28 family amino/carboxypeptidase
LVQVLIEKQGSVRLFILDLNKKYMGKMDVSQFTVRRYFTFLDMVHKNHLNVVPIIGIDFSMANLTMDDASILHTLKPGARNDYVEAIRATEQAFKNYSNFRLAYGFGARTHTRGEGQDACDLFSMTGSY